VIYDLAIIGGGPAGVSAGVYAARKKLNAILITKDFGGQSVESLEIQNWIGTVAISGFDLSQSLKKHLKAYAGDTVVIKEGELAEKIEKKSENFIITTGKNSYEAKTVLVVSGGRRRRLEVPGAEMYENKGIIYCASCDGPLYADKDTLVVGAGNAGFETAAQLLAYAKSVTLIARGDNFRADPITVEKIGSHPKMKILRNTEIKEVKGDKFVNGVTLKNNLNGEESEMPVEGIFVEIGHLPNTDMVKGLVDLDEYNRIKIDPRNQRTSLLGVWAAGDCTDGLYHQNNIAAGDAVKALEDIYLYVHTK
jgi:alkyl hydroperoxide reductase subunit F